MSKKEKRVYTKSDILTFIVKNLLIILGTLLIAFGNAIFCTKLNIVSGGLSGVGIIVQSFIPDSVTIFGGQIIDIVVYALSGILWIVGFIFVGKKFALRTLLSSIAYPLALSLFLRVGLFTRLAESICYYGIADPSGITQMPIQNLLLCGLFGGVFIGAGVGLAFLGGGCSGGTDIIIALICKYINIKESIVSFGIDGIIVACGIFLIKDNIVPGLCGIICACVTALLVEFCYGRMQSCYQVDIISEHNDEISRYAQDTLHRGATIVTAVGGYKGDQRPILRVVINRYQYNKLKDFIASVDKTAFVTFTQTNAVFGEGFKRHQSYSKKAK